MCDIDCRECEGTGRVEITCGYCAGSGEGRHDGSRCINCRGHGVEPNDECEECGGSGKIDCEEYIARLIAKVAELESRLYGLSLKLHKYALNEQSGK
jgi:DnaJ-class molecular chaperone